ncbi:MAG: ABC transporter permease [Caldilineae bacterium]|nr:MAG: ABC transporter permease [Caldilineae bacterium]
MTIAGYQVGLKQRAALSGWQAALISLFAILVALVLFSLVFILDGVNPLAAYREIFSYAFVNQYGLVLSLSRFIFLLLSTYAFIIPARAGLWNIGMTGQLYVGSLCAYGVVYALGGKASQSVYLPPLLVIPLMMLAAAIGGALLGGLAGLLKGRFDVNEIVSTMLLNFIAFWLVSEMIKEGGIFMNPQGRSESFALPASLHAPTIAGIPFTVLIALALAVVLKFLFDKTRIGYQIKAFGLNPAAARYAGISPPAISVLVFVLGGAIAGLAGYHYFAAVPGVYKIARNYSYFGDLAFYGIIAGLISLGDPLAAIPVSLLFGGMSNGGRWVQGKLHMGFGLDYALLGLLMITLVGFQFFYRYQITWQKEEAHGDVAIPG